jgi:hypothetical protein
MDTVFITRKTVSNELKKNIFKKLTIILQAIFKTQGSNSINSQKTQHDVNKAFLLEILD